MLKHYLLFAFTFSYAWFYCACAIAQESKPAVIQPLAGQSLLLDIAKVSDYKVIAVGERGHILSSTDGDNWQQLNVPTQVTLTGVFFLDEHLGWAVGHNSTILFTQDGGVSWKIQQRLPRLKKPLFDIVFKNSKEGLAIGSYGQFYRTIDGGQTWNSEFHQTFLTADDINYLHKLELEDEEAYLDEIQSILPHFNRIFMDGRTLFLVGENGVIAKSNDFGKSWKELDRIYPGSFFDITRTLRGNVVVAGLRGHAFRSTTNAKTWQKSSTATQSLINSIVVGDEGRIFLLGNNGTLLESYNDGITFHHLHQFDKSHLISGVFFKNRLIVASSNGIKAIEVDK